MIAELKGRIGARLARSYVSGPELFDALRSWSQARSLGWSCTLSFWDGAGDTPDTVAGRCHGALDALASDGIDGQLSAKAPALGHDTARVTELLDHAVATDRRIHFDSHGAGSAEAGLRLLERVAGGRRKMGCTLPARWERSLRDVERVLPLRIPVRVVKGQWPDDSGRDGDVRARYLALVDALAGRCVSVSVATHDVALARQALARLRAAATPCELEQLFGLPVREGVARAQGVGVRLYIPFGNGTLPYRPSALGGGLRVVRDAFFGWRGVC